MLENPKALRTKVRSDANLTMVTIARDTAMGNQQERSLSWLAGILDGEGTISAQVITMSDGRVRITPFVGIVNTDEGILDGCREILNSAGVKHRTYAKPIIGSGFEGRIACANIRIDGHKPVQILLPLVMPYLRSVKREHAQKVLQFISMRTVGLFEHDERGRIRRREYTRAEVEILSSVRTHARAKSSETICEAPNVLG